MNLRNVQQRLTITLFLCLVLAVFVAAFHAISNIVAEQSRLQQQALSPVYKLVREELLRPLYIAETFATSVDFTTVMGEDNIDEVALLARLKKMEDDLGLVFFVASEKKRKQYFSNGRTIELIEGDVWWYFEALESDKDFMADLGQVGDVHLFFDVRMYSEQDEFVGYVGVGKRIQQFLETFDRYKARYGYDFLFVNERDEIILASIPNLVVMDAYIPALSSLGWFEEDTMVSESLDGALIRREGQDYLVSELAIEELDWRLLLLSPLEARQAQITRSFATNTLTAVALVLLLAAMGFYLALVYKRNVERSTEIDPLSGLPNRKHVQRRFEQLRRNHQSLCAIMVDLDHFKDINDTHGHGVGDQVIRKVAIVLKKELRERDVIGRWGGEEFLMLIPAGTMELGKNIAERARQALRDLHIDGADGDVEVSASFGVAFGSAAAHSLSDLLSAADTALYEAKRSGRNQVRTQLLP
ncbi:MAG: sensor domain-containing diguanylate cyclase [Pseudomonadota bacterium]